MHKITDKELIRTWDCKRELRHHTRIRWNNAK